MTALFKCVDIVDCNIFVEPYTKFDDTRAFVRTMKAIGVFIGRQKQYYSIINFNNRLRFFKSANTSFDDILRT